MKNHWKIIISALFIILYIQFNISFVYHILRFHSYGYSILNIPLSSNDRFLFEYIMFMHPGEINRVAGIVGLPLHLAVYKKNEYFVRRLVEKTEDINYIAPCGWTPLEFAIDSTSGERIRISKNVVKCLLENGADVNKINTPHKGYKEPSMAPIHRVILKDDLEITRLFLEHKGNPNLQNENGETPLHLAVVMDNLENARILIEYKADPLIRDNKNKTPLDYAKEYKFEKMVEFLEKSMLPVSESLNL